MKKRKNLTDLDLGKTPVTAAGRKESKQLKNLTEFNFEKKGG